MTKTRRILHLSLYAEFFTAILRGEKPIEYRRRSPRWDKMLRKSYDAVRFVNGYGSRRPWMDCEIVRIEETPEQWLIHISPPFASGNLDLLKL
jgi:hypothetical protein